MPERVMGMVADALPVETLKAVEKSLFFAGMGHTARQWASLSLMCAAVSMMVLASSLPLVLGMERGALAAALLSFLLLGAMAYYPAVATGLRAGAVERELPVALRSMASQLAISLPFEACLESVSEGYGELSKEVKMALSDVESGESMRNALLAIGDRVDSRAVRRAAAHLAISYEKGGSGGSESLKKVAEELVARQNSASREFGGKLVMYSLVFIAVSVILPAFFQAFVIVGSSFMSQTIEPMEALLIPIVVFPAVDIAILAFIRMRRPAFL